MYHFLFLLVNLSTNLCLCNIAQQYQYYMYSKDNPRTLHRYTTYLDHFLMQALLKGSYRLTSVYILLPVKIHLVLWCS